MSPGKAAGRERRSAAIRDALHAFSLEQAADPSVHQLLLPLRDGLTWVQPAPDAALDAGVDAGLDSALEPSALEPSSEPSSEAAPLATSSLARYLATVGSDEPSPMRSLRTTAAEGETAAGEAPGAASAPLRGRLLQMEPRPQPQP